MDGAGFHVTQALKSLTTSGPALGRVTEAVDTVTLGNTRPLSGTGAPVWTGSSSPLGLPDVSLGICHQNPATMALWAHRSPKAHTFFLKRPSRVSELLEKKNLP